MAVRRRSITTATHDRRRVLSHMGFLLLVVFAVSVSACWSNSERTDSGDASSTDFSTPLNAGASAFESNCTVCHGAVGQGHPEWQIRNDDGTLRPPPLNGDGHTWYHSDGVLYRIVREGEAIPGSPSFKSGMPAFGDTLTHDEIVDALTYVKSLWHDKTFSGDSIADIQAQRSVADPYPSRSG